jgi:hypothetical protein
MEWSNVFVLSDVVQKVILYESTCAYIETIALINSFPKAEFQTLAIAPNV